MNYAVQVMAQLPEDSNWFIYGGDMLCSKENAAFLKSKPFKLFCVTQGSDYLNTPVNPAFVALYQEKYGTKPSYEAALAYDATKLILSAIAKVESADAGKLSIALKQQSWLKGAAGEIEFDEAGNNIKRKGFVYEAIDGELRLKEIIN